MRQNPTCTHSHTHTHTSTCHGNGSSWFSGQRKGSSCTLYLTGQPSACPDYAQPTGSQICSDGQWNDRSHGLNRHNQELDTSCFEDSEGVNRQWEEGKPTVKSSFHKWWFNLIRVQRWPVVEAVLVGSRVTDGFTGDRGREGGLAWNQRLPHACIQTNTERWTLMWRDIIQIC